MKDLISPPEGFDEITYRLEAEQKGVVGPSAVNAYIATKTYLAYGGDTPEYEDLRFLATEMTSVRCSPLTAAVRPSVYVDLAAHPNAAPADTELFIDTAHSLDNRGASPLEEVAHFSRPMHIQGSILLAHAENYRKALLGRALTVEDEELAYNALLRAATRVVEVPQHSRSMIYHRSAITLGVQLLFARHNIKLGNIDAHARPSFLRQRHYHKGQEGRSGWDMAVSSNTYLDPEAILIHSRNPRYRNMPRKTDQKDVFILEDVRHLHANGLGLLYRFMRAHPTERSKNGRKNANKELNEITRRLFAVIGLAET